MHFFLLTGHLNSRSDGHFCSLSINFIQVFQAQLVLEWLLFLRIHQLATLFIVNILTFLSCCYRIPTLLSCRGWGLMGSPFGEFPFFKKNNNDFFKKMPYSSHSLSAPDAAICYPPFFHLCSALAPSHPTPTPLPISLNLPKRPALDLFNVCI